jgi:hypothetical protein
MARTHARTRAHTHTQTLGMHLTCKKRDYWIPQCAMTDYNPDCWKMTQSNKNSNKHVVSLVCLLVLYDILRIITLMTHFDVINNTSHNTTNCMYTNLYFSSTKLLNASTYIFTKLAVCFTYKTCVGGEHDFHSLILNTCYK